MPCAHPKIAANKVAVPFIVPTNFPSYILAFFGVTSYYHCKLQICFRKLKFDPCLKQFGQFLEKKKVKFGGSMPPT